MGKGGGGSAGSVKYATYLENYQKLFIGGDQLLTIPENYVTALKEAWALDPYAPGAVPFVYEDPATEIGNNLTRWGELNTLVDGMTVEGTGGDWRKYLTEAVEQIDVAGVLNSVDVDSLATAARAGGANVATAIDGLGSLTPIDANAIMTASKSGGASVATAIGGLISLSPVDVATEATNSRAGAVLAKDAVVGTYLDWNTAIDAVVTKLATASPDIDVAGTISSFFTDITMADLFTLVEGRLATMINTIVTNSFAAVNPTLLQNLADAFVAQRANERARTRTRYKAGAVARGGEASSAYALGLALLDGDFSTETSTFQTQATLQLYQQGIETYNSLLQGYLGNTAQVEIANRSEKTRFAGAAVTANKQLKDQFLTTHTLEKMSNSVQKTQTDISVYIEAFRNELMSRVQAKINDSDQVLQKGLKSADGYTVGLNSEVSGRVQAATTDKTADTQHLITKINGYVEAFRSELMARVSLKSEEKKIRDGMIDKNISAMLQYRQFIVSTNEEVTALRSEISRINYVMDSEYIGNTLDRNVNSAMYRMKLVEQAVPMLGALGGGTALPDKHNKMGSALGGALTGAIAGSAVPGLGTAAGLIGGGILGGAAGLFGG